jgi:UDP-N-acetylmuramate--alanine ligase
MREFVRHVHFVGIGGSGMCGIAEVLLTQGYRVSGSDLIESAATLRLRENGAEIHIGHDAGNVDGADVVVASSAVAADNVELVAAHQAHIPVVPRAEMLGELMRFRMGIAIAGTHGKTTTTSLVAAVLAGGGLDPTFVVGGMVNSVHSNARLGSGEYLVAEADESDASFLHLQPFIAVVTNIDADHLEAYHGDFDELAGVFLDFLHNLPFYGLAILCIDDPVVRGILPSLRKPVLTYGTVEDADFRAVNIRQIGPRMHFAIERPGAAAIEVDLALPGRHNVLNATAAVAVAVKLGIGDDAIVASLGSFEGIGRRFDVLGELEVAGGRALVLDDYAHHPREIASTLDAARGCWPGRRLVVVFQPHRFTRTRDLLDDFALLLSEQECLVVSEVYAAGERPISGADGRALCRAIRARGRVDPVFIEDIRQLPDALASLVAPDDVVVTLGAGDIGRAARQLAVVGLPVERSSA